MGRRRSNIGAPGIWEAQPNPACRNISPHKICGKALDRALYIWSTVHGSTISSAHGVALSWRNCKSGESPVQIRRCRAAVRPQGQARMPVREPITKLPFARKGVIDCRVLPWLQSALVAHICLR